MTKKDEIAKIRKDREYDTEWLMKYKRIVDGLQQIAEIQSDGCNSDFDEWATLSSGLASLSKRMQEDIEGRKDVD